MRNLLELQGAHPAVTHRDLKSRNILIAAKGQGMMLSFAKVWLLTLKGAGTLPKEHQPCLCLCVLV